MNATSRAMPGPHATTSTVAGLPVTHEGRVR